MKAMNLTKKILVIALLTAVAACNTVKGAGQDIESVGRAGDRAIHN